MKIRIADPSLVVLIGAAGSGKSQFARRHFAATEIVSSDHCRALVCDDEANQQATAAAFEVAHLIARKRLMMRRLTVFDATSVHAWSRRRLVEIAAETGVPVTAIAFDYPESLCAARNLERAHRRVPLHVIWRQAAELRRSLAKLKSEGFAAVYAFNDPAEVEKVVVEDIVTRL
jgi:protein phosphatase